MNKLRITVVGSDWAFSKWYIAKGASRDPVRSKEAKGLEEDLSIANISNVFDWVKINIFTKNSRNNEALLGRKPKEYVKVVNDPLELFKLVPETDLFVIYSYLNDSVLKAIENTGIPILLAWDAWGWDHDSRYERDVLLGHSCHVPFLFGREDLEIALYAAKGLKKLRETRAICIGKWPSGTVKSGLDVEKMAETLGFGIDFIPPAEYIKSNEECSEIGIQDILQKLNSKYNLEKGSPYTVNLARNYVAIKKLLKKYSANCFAIDCLSFENINYSPCAALGLLEDEGIIYACEADLPTLVPHIIMNGMSGMGGFLGNFCMVHLKHEEIENNTIAIEHDVLPPTWCNGKCKVLDHHGSGFGSTLWGDVKIKDVTVSGLSRDGSHMHAFTGSITEIKDLVHCRMGLWIKTDQNVKDILKNVVGHHQIVVPGKWLKQLNLAAKWLGKIPLMDVNGIK